MKRLFLALLALVCGATPLLAHDVPDVVRIPVFLKPHDGRMTMLVRMPANALIDFLFPQFADGGLDLTVADGIAAEGAQVWIADLLTIYENGTKIPTPHVLKVRISRLNDPFFGTFDDALSSVNGPPLGKEAFVSLDQAVVDALLEAPIDSPGSRFSFEPRFGRLGVLVYTTLTFLPPGGEVRQFVYEGDPETFDLNPTRGRTLTTFARTGMRYVISERASLWLIVCIALVFTRPRRGIPFVILLVATEFVALIALLAVLPPSPWIPVVSGLLIAAATTFVGIEAIVAVDGARLGLAVAAGTILAAGCWSGLHPIVQFGGAHAFAAASGFMAGAMLVEIAALAIATALVQVGLRVSRAPRAAVIIAAAIAIHISWRQMLDRADALALTPPPLPAPAALAAAVTGLALIMVVAVRTSKGRGQGDRESGRWVNG
jgi:hypothetical protein